MSDEKEKLQDLHIECVRALRNYMTEANKTCKLLTDFTEFSISRHMRSKILEQRKIENKAYDFYQFARRDLFGAAGWESVD